VRTPLLAAASKGPEAGQAAEESICAPAAPQCAAVDERPGAQEGVGESWLQRKVSVLAPPQGSSIGAVTGLVAKSFKEVEQYRLGLAHLQVQTAGYHLSQGASAQRTKSLSLPLAKGEIILGDVPDAADVLLHADACAASDSAPTSEAGKRVCEILVTLQGDRGLRGAHAATHVVGQPRLGDEQSVVLRLVGDTLVTLLPLSLALVSILTPACMCCTISSCVQEASLYQLRRCLFRALHPKP
jgi:hypothetical protein